VLLGTHVPLLAQLSFLRALTDFWVVRALIFALASSNICPVPRIVIGNSRGRRKQGLRQTSEVLGAAVSSLRLTAPKNEAQVERVPKTGPGPPFSATGTETYAAVR
jgi:hypothetical protein